MSTPAVASLPALQAVDLEDDAFRRERLELAERAALAEAAKEVQRLAAERAEAATRRNGLDGEEARCDQEAARVRERAGELENHLYSGQVKVARELEALQEELTAVRGQLDGIESEQMEVMERIEALEGEMRGIDGAERELGRRIASLEDALSAGESRIDAELERLDGMRQKLRPQVAPALLGVYDRLRQKDRLRGRVVAFLETDTCSACRTSLPVVEARKAREAPVDQRVQCPHCERLLLRG